MRILKKLIPTASPDDVELIRNTWEIWARPDQLPPEPLKPIWLVLGGRGAGKTRTGAEWVKGMALGHPPFADMRTERIALVGETQAQVRDVMIEGVSGLLSIHTRWERPTWQPSLRRLQWTNGAIAQVFTAEDPEGLRGPQFGAAWSDELAKWPNLQECWDMLQFGLRLGDNPRQVVTTTPRPLPLVKRLLVEPHVAVSRARTQDNHYNLAAEFVRTVTQTYGGTRLGRQELDGEIVEESPDALWTRAMIEAAREREKPTLARIAVAVDPPATSSQQGDHFEVIEERAAIVRRVYDLTLQGVGQHAITAMFNKEGVEPFGTARWWHRSYVRLLLKNPAVVGTFIPHRMVNGRREPLEPILNYFPQVVSSETFEAVRALDRPAGEGPTKAIASVFSGVVKCEECGGPMIRTRKGQAPKPFYHVFVCHNAKLGQSCECRTVRQSTLEDALTASIDAFIENAPTHDGELTEELERIETGIEVTRDQATALVEAIAQRPLPQLIDRLAVLDTALAEMAVRKTEIEAALRDTARPVVMKRLMDLEAVLSADGPDARQRANVLLRQVVDHAVIRFDREASRRKPRGRLDFVWKGGGRSYLEWGPTFYPEPRNPEKNR